MKAGRFAILFALLPVLGSGQQVGPLIQASDPPAVASGPAPLHLAETFGAEPLAVLPAAAEAAAEKLQTLMAWNDSGRVPVRNGIVRRLPAPRRVALTAELLERAPDEHAGGVAAPTAFDRLAWGSEVRIEGAYRLRLHLAEVRLPAGTRIWVYGDDEVAGPFGPELRGPDGGLWTPSVAGEAVRIDVELPAGALDGGARFGFTVDRVLEIVPVDADDPLLKADDLPCEIDVACVNPGELGILNAYRHAVARIEFVRDGSGFLCSGGLLNDTDPNSEIPYFLTAHHCLSTQESAASLEAFWDFYRTSCRGSVGAAPRSAGATLLATSDRSDFTLLRLNRVPGGRFFLGWNADPEAVSQEGVLIYRISHPGGRPQAYSVMRVDTSFPACRGRLRPDYIYSTRVNGGTAGGSSGAPTVLANGQVVGQLFGSCGNSDNCSGGQLDVDGAFASTFPMVRQFLDPGLPCSPGPTTLCLLGKRFRVQVDWQSQYSGESGTARVVPRSDSTGFFYFTSPSNYELILKMLDFGDVIKVFYGQLTDFHFTITITDTQTGEVKRYQNGPNNCGAIDQSAFPGSRASTASRAMVFEAARGPRARGTCRPDADTLCLLDRRLQVEITWRNHFSGDSGKGFAGTLTDESGLFTYGDPTNVELVVKALDFGDRILFFWGALSDLEYTITVTNTTNNAVKTYHNPGGQFCGGIDNNAF